MWGTTSSNFYSFQISDFIIIYSPFPFDANIHELPPSGFTLPVTTGAKNEPVLTNKIILVSNCYNIVVQVLAAYRKLVDEQPVDQKIALLEIIWIKY